MWWLWLAGVVGVAGDGLASGGVCGGCEEEMKKERFGAGFFVL